MPLYFFHLSFGDRTVADDEGVELPNRSAARAEALAVIRDLADPEVAGNPRRWAGWFLQVADEKGEFLRMAIGHPALEVVVPRVRAQAAGSKPVPRPAATARDGSWSSRSRPADLIRELSQRQERAAQLFERTRHLQHEISLLCATSELLRQRARHLVAHARAASATGHDIEIFRIANEVVRPPSSNVVALRHPPRDR